MSYLTQAQGAAPGSPATVDYVTTQAVSKTSALGDSMAGPLTIPGLNGSGTATGVAAGANAGTGAAISAYKGHDLGGQFVLTAGTTPAAGTLAVVTFASANAAAPASVVVTCWDNTGAAGILVGVASITATGFSILGPALTAAHAYLINYFVIDS